jgi:hypothetical protein
MDASLPQPGDAGRYASESRSLRSSSRVSFLRARDCHHSSIVKQDGRTWILLKVRFRLFSEERYSCTNRIINRTLRFFPSSHGLARIIT